MSHNLPNGIPPQMNTQDKQFTSSRYPVNGLGSSHSSRDPSPAASRLHQIPSSQLPPSRTAIPVSQLPPSSSKSGSISQLTQNYTQLNVSSNNSKENTPFSSPGPQKFLTSTPNMEPTKTVSQPQENVLTRFSSSHFDKTNVYAPVPTTVQQGVQKVPVTNFSHSASSQFTNVPLSTSGSNQIAYSDKHPFQNKADSKTRESSDNLSHSTSVQKNVITSSSQPVSKTGTEFSQDYFHRQQTGTITSQHTQNPTIQSIVKVQQNNQYGTNNIQHSSAGQQLTQNTFATMPLPKPPLQPSYSQPYSSTPNIASVRSAQNKQELHYPSNFNQSQKALPSIASIPNLAATSSEQYMYSQQMTSNTQPNMSSTYYQQPTQTLQSNLQFTPSVSNHTANQPRDAINSQFIASSTTSMHTPYKAPLHGNRYPIQYNVSTVSQQTPYQNTKFIQQPTYQVQQPSYFQKPSPNVFQQPTPSQNYNQNFQNVQQNFNQSVTHSGFNKLWGTESYDLLQCPNILPPTKIEPPKVNLGQELLDAANCSSEIFRCTITKVPESSSLLSKSRLPLGVLIHPFKDLNHLPVIQCNTIVRCRACRTYINPFVFFVDTKRWKCNICYRINELPEEFQYDPVSKTYGDPSRRPEVRASTIEYIAPAEYMLRPPQPAVYMFLLDVSRVAIESGYLYTICNVLTAELKNLPGDARAQIGFLAYDSALHFYSLAEGQSQPHEMTILDIDDVFLPCPENLLVNLNDKIELITDLLAQLPTRYNNSFDNGSALGAALQVAHKLMAATGGRITVFQASLPSLGPGSLTSREDPSQRASAEIQHLNPANDFYKRLALECSGQQIAVDLFIINSQYIDLATISGISRFSGGCIHHFPLYKAERTLQSNYLERTFKRYLTRKIGFEAVMRIRCTRGLAIHTFHGNFFVRSTDLLSLPNVNPDSGFGMQVSIEENLSDLQTVCFQAALLYTSSKGERRIRVHTLCLPVVSTLSDIINAADQQCIIGLLAKMAVDRSMQSSLSDAREAFINVAIDILSSYKLSLNMGSGPNGLMAPQCLRLLPLYISAILKYIAFRTGTSTRLDDRVKAMCDMKTKPLPYLIQLIYPDLYPIHDLDNQTTTVINDDEEPVPIPPHLQLTARSLDSNGAYLLDMGEHMIIIVGSAVSIMFLNQVLGVSNYNSITEDMNELPVLDNPSNQRLHSFINYLNDEKPIVATLQIHRDNSPNRGIFLEKLIEDRIENALSYHEFLQHLKTQVK